MTAVRSGLSIDQVSDVLAHSEIFRGLDRGALEELASAATQRSYKKGQLIFTQGDAGEALYVIVRGFVKVFLTSERGEEIILVTLRPPAGFGELAVVDGRPRSASVEALENTSLLVVRRSVLLEMMHDNPALTEGILRSLGSILRRLTGQASDFVFLDLNGRVAKLLVTLAAGRGKVTPEGIVLDLRVSQGDIARMVGGSRQSINQILRSFENRGFLEIQGRTIVLKDPESLRRRAGEPSLDL